MPRRYATYLKTPELQAYHVSPASALLQMAAFLLIAGYLTYSLFRGRQAPANPWGGTTLEWSCSSPPPHDNFASPPSAGNASITRAWNRTPSTAAIGAAGWRPCPARNPLSLHPVHHGRNRDSPDDLGHASSHLAHHFDTPEQQFDSGKLGIWLFLTTEILLFSGLFCAYAVFRQSPGHFRVRASSISPSRWGPSTRWC